MDDKEIDKEAAKSIYKLDQASQRTDAKEAKARAVLSAISSGMFHTTNLVLSSKSVENFLQGTHGTGCFRLLSKEDLKDDLDGLLIVLEIDGNALVLKYSRMFRNQAFKELFILEARSPDVVSVLRPTVQHNSSHIVTSIFLSKQAPLGLHWSPRSPHNPPNFGENWPFLSKWSPTYPSCL